MKCYYHKDEEAVGGCVGCGHLVCADCKTMLGEKTYCRDCADRLVAETSETETPITKRPSWFERHLNWTWFFAWISTPFAWYLVILGVAWVADNWPPLDRLLTDELFLFELIMWLTWLVVYLAIMVPVSVYVLRRKGRSFWWLLLIFSYLPFPMFLKNKLGRGLL